MVFIIPYALCFIKVDAVFFEVRLTLIGIIFKLHSVNIIPYLYFVGATCSYFFVNYLQDGSPFHSSLLPFLYRLLHPGFHNVELRTDAEIIPFLFDFSL